MHSWLLVPRRPLKKLYLPGVPWRAPPRPREEARRRSVSQGPRRPVLGSSPLARDLRPQEAAKTPQGPEQGKTSHPQLLPGTPLTDSPTGIIVLTLSRTLPRGLMGPCSTASLERSGGLGVCVCGGVKSNSTHFYPFLLLHALASCLLYPRPGEAVQDKVGFRLVGEQRQTSQQTSWRTHLKLREHGEKAALRSWGL